MTEQTQPMPATFSTDTALLWVQLADETPEGQTFPVVPSELLLLLSTFLETRTALLRAQVRLQSLTSMAQNAVKIVNEQRVLIDDMKAALPADWVPARIRNEQDAAATAPQDVANEAPQGDPGDESPSFPAVEAAE